MRLPRQRALLAAIAVAWIASLLLPAIHLPNGSTYDGAELLRRAWAAPRAGVFSWYANPLFVGALALGALGRLRAAGVASAVAFFLGLTSFAAEPLARASGAAVPALAWGVGFYLWLAALAGLCIWAWAYVAFERSGSSAGTLSGAMRD